MAPGARKKNTNRKADDNVQVSKRCSSNNVGNNSANSRETTPKSDVTLVENDTSQDKRYSKRSLSSNWQRYEETPIDPHADTMRGEDIEVLISYSGGSGSQLQLQEEKEWEDSSIDEKSIALDIKDLIHVVKSIPFHKQINVPDNIFTEDQLSKFESSAEKWKTSYTPKLESSLKKEKIDKVINEVETLDSNLNIIDSCEPNEIKETTDHSKPVLLEEKTENIIESLASCLSLKASVSEKNNSNTKTMEENENVNDDLDFLLSLNVSLKNPLQDVKQNESQKTNVDDWLNSILDD